MLSLILFCVGVNSLSGNNKSNSCCHPCCALSSPTLFCSLTVSVPTPDIALARLLEYFLTIWFITFFATGIPPKAASSLPDHIS